MARPRLPLASARIKGADKRNPARFADRSDPKAAPLGEPSKWLDSEQAEAWEMFRREVPWLMESDRVVVEIAVVIRARMMSGEQVGVGALNQLRLCAGQMGTSPAARSKITLSDERDDDPSHRYFA